MIKKTFRGVIQVLAGLGAGLAILVVLVAWLLSSGPISLGWLSPYVEDALNTYHKSLRVRLDDTILTWAGWDRTLDVRIVGVRALGKNDEILASIPELSVSMSARALMRGLVVPEKVELFRPRMKLIREWEGGFRLGFVKASQGADAVFSKALTDLLADSDPNNAMSYLQRIEITDADLIYEDEGFQASWQAPNSDITFWREKGSIKGEVATELEVKGVRTEVNVLGTFQVADRRLDLGIDFGDIKPSSFADISPKLADLQALEVPVRGTVTFSMMAGGVIESVGFNLTGGVGRIWLPGPVQQTVNVDKVEFQGRFDGATSELVFDKFAADLGKRGVLLLPAGSRKAGETHKLPFRSFDAKGRYATDRKTLRIESLSADLHGPKARLNGIIDGIGGEMTLEGAGVLRNVAADSLQRYWPKGWGVDPRNWITANISKGVVTEARASFAALSNKKGEFEFLSLSGTMDLKGMSVDYLPPMPKAEKIDATVSFNRRRFDITITKGEVAGLKSSSGNIVISGLDEYDQYLDLDMKVAGPVRKAMQLIDHKPLEFARTLKIDPLKTGGLSETHLKMRFIVEHALTLDRVDISASSELTDVEMPEIVFGLNISKGQLGLVVDKKGMDVAGNVQLGPIPAKFAWRENFTDDAPYLSRYRVSGTVQGMQDTRSLGIDLSPFPPEFLKGDVGADVWFTSFMGKRGELIAKLDLKDASVSLPAISWNKEQGIPGIAETHIITESDRVVDIPKFLIQTAGLSVAGAARYAKDGTGLNRIDFDRLAYGRTDLKGALVSLADGGWHVIAHGPSLDLAPVFDTLLRGEPEGEMEETVATMKINLTTDMDKVWVDGDSFISKVSGTFSRSDKLWKSIRLKGTVGPGKSMQLTIDPLKNGKRSLKLVSNDAGTVLRTFEYYDTMVGGDLTISGVYDDTAPGQPLDGRVEIKNFRIVDAPTLAHLVSILALTGILDALRGDGLSFTSLDAPFSLVDGTLSINDAKASGLSLGFTATGKVYTHAEVLDMEGTVVPAYAINSLFSNIPILGKLLSGGEEGGGIFAATYNMSGPMEHPEISVNPLSALAPGFLRNLFGLFDSEKASSGAPLNGKPQAPKSSGDHKAPASTL